MMAHKIFLLIILLAFNLNTSKMDLLYLLMLLSYIFNIYSKNTKIIMFQYLILLILSFILLMFIDKTLIN